MTIKNLIIGMFLCIPVITYAQAPKTNAPKSDPAVEKILTQLDVLANKQVAESIRLTKKVTDFTQDLIKNLEALKKEAGTLSDDDQIQIIPQIDLVVSTLNDGLKLSRDQQAALQAQLKNIKKQKEKKA